MHDDPLRQIGERDSAVHATLVNRLLQTRLSRLEALHGVAAGALAGLAGLALSEAGEAANPANRVLRRRAHRRHKARQQRRKRHNRQDHKEGEDQNPGDGGSVGGTPYLALDLYVENRLGREVSLSWRGTNTNWGNDDIQSNYSLYNGGHYDLYGHHEADDSKTISRWEVFVQGPATPVWLMVENPNLWPLNVSVMEGGYFRWNPATSRYDTHVDRWLVDRQWLLGGQIVTTVADARVRVTYERQADTATHMVVHAWLDPA
jgi:hypothetical protein